jgi:hypothetical protein
MKVVVSDLAHLLDRPQVLHSLHDGERPWPQTNCSVDLLIELVAAYGFDPVWMLAFTLTLDFEGDHFTFFKVPSEDLEALYGLSIQELAVWDELEGHVVAQLRRNRVVMVEVDGFYLPDTRGVTYQINHGKTTIGIFSLDSEHQRLGYFHNETCGVLEGDDYDAVLQKLPSQSTLLMPYCEMVKRLAPPSQDPAAVAWNQLCRHGLRRPVGNPFRAYAEVFAEHVERMREGGPSYFHAYAFNTLRQAGANFGLMESFLLAAPDWGLAAAAASAKSMAEDAKVLQFKMARAVARKNFEGLDKMVTGLAETYDRLITQLGVLEPSAHMDRASILAA